MYPREKERKQLQSNKYKKGCKNDLGKTRSKALIEMTFILLTVLSALISLFAVERRHIIT